MWNDVRRSGGRRPWLVVVLIASRVIRLILGWLYLGFVSGDDVEMLEAGIAPATDLDYALWAIRNLLFPLLLVIPVVWVANRGGWGGPAQLVRLAVLPFVALATVNVLLVQRIVRRAAGEREAVVAAAADSCSARRRSPFLVPVARGRDRLQTAS